MRSAVTSRTVWTNHRFTPLNPSACAPRHSAELVFRPAGLRARAARGGRRFRPAAARRRARERARALGTAVERRLWQLRSAGSAPRVPRARRRADQESFVYASPCAEHVLAFMLSWARRLPWALRAQWGERTWPQGSCASTRCCSRGSGGAGGHGLDRGALGGAACGRLRRTLIGVRRRPRGDEAIPTLGFEDPALTARWARRPRREPAARTTRRSTFSTRSASALLLPGAIFYNVGRGSTVDQTALAALLTEGRLQAALLDVTDPEPCPRAPAVASAQLLHHAPRRGGTTTRAIAWSTISSRTCGASSARRPCSTAPSEERAARERDEPSRWRRGRHDYLNPHRCFSAAGT
jgi:hypothetical protein